MNRKYIFYWSKSLWFNMWKWNYLNILLLINLNQTNWGLTEQNWGNVTVQYNKGKINFASKYNEIMKPDGCKQFLDFYAGQHYQYGKTFFFSNKVNNFF